MTGTSKEILKHLPYLRRYARALVGSQERGDQYMRVFLEAILADPERVSPDGDLRAQLFAVFHDVCTLLDATGGDGVPALEGLIPVEARLSHLSAVQRQVLLLVSLEGFSFADVGYILHLPEVEVRDQLDAARKEMQRQHPARILIIEDEPLIAMDIARIVEEMGHTVCGTAADHAEALALSQRTAPHIVLADIQLKGGDSGIAAVQDILRAISVPVVFVTGFPERLLTGERLEPTFVVTKPFKPDALVSVIGQALAMHPPLPAA
ncbi:CheY-like chemotaxis protein/DNA-directed RNA polymerase specialized sigma24 family protein [Inquilinus ginsengisoli]|uniref:CheY-like chemotaxis protein/DNA-directed RNA polymerase specialized sigma24 family protein n=1 Tax=Inquilinus ginsengisoli TaxID=363840 RepID=A0ABU1K216_9PROT|nr:response regulator [Inquilinus ginsengisoli]MDR6294552.1 CheY-like chemotaxis protein/DNA-directed RNA polymerase specialized sigma24 family protein [Inquilinus ginsengisoli]